MKSLLTQERLVVSRYEDKSTGMSLNVAYIMQCRRGMKTDIDKLENMNLPEYENISIFMALLHDQDSSLY